MRRRRPARSRSRPPTFSLGAGAVPRDRRRAARRRPRRRSRATTRSCSARSAAGPATRGSQDANIERGLLLKLRFALDHYVNLRPDGAVPRRPEPARRTRATSTSSSCARAPRARTSATAARCATGTPHEVANEVCVNTAFGVERVVRYAFDAGRRAPQRRLTLVHKTNVLVIAGALWQRIVDEVAAGAPGRRRRLPARRRGDDLPRHGPGPLRRDRHRQPLRRHPHRPRRRRSAAASASPPPANLNPDGAFPSMFEPVHGSAPDIAGTGRRPTPPPRSSPSSLLLDHLGPRRRPPAASPRAVPPTSPHGTAQPAPPPRSATRSCWLPAYWPRAQTGA